MPGKEGERPENGDNRDLFDDQAIRRELRKIVEREADRLMKKTASEMDEVRRQYDALEDVDEDAKRLFFSRLETGQIELERRFQLMLDFIERN